MPQAIDLCKIIVSNSNPDSETNLTFEEKGLNQRGITPVIPPKANRKTPRACDFALYCERNLVERFFNQLKHFRAIATRYDKLARNFLAGVQMAAAMILLN